MSVVIEKSQKSEKSEKSEHISLAHYEATDYEFTEERNLTNIIFLPFNGYWQLLVIFTIILNYLLCLHNAVFDASHNLISEIIYFSCELLFSIDTICVVIHRYLSKIRKLKYHLKKSIIFITISIVTLIPFDQFYSLLDAYGWQQTVRSYHHSIPTFLRLKCACRLFIIHIFFLDKRNGVSERHLLMIIFQQFVLIFLLSSTLSAVWYRLSCWRCDRRNWTDSINNSIFNYKNLSSWIIICWYTVVSVFAHTWIGYIIAKTFVEKCFLITCMLIGFLLHSMFFFGLLTVEFLQLYRALFEFKARMKKIVYLLNDWKVDKQIKHRTMEYYKVFWNKNHGIKDMPVAFQFLPASLQKEITLDIYWEFIRHSHILRDTDISFKRAISLAMKTSFLLPGDYLLKINDNKTSMIYITSGIVTLLSEEDDESPIMSLSGGTLLGDIACLLDVKCAANIRCETYCKIQTLTLPDLCKVLVNHGHIKKDLLHQLHDRINYVRWVTSDEVPKEDLERNFKEEKSTIKTLKRQWKYIFKMNRSKKIDDSNWVHLNRCFTSDYLDSLVLTDVVEHKLQVICLTSNWPFIMDPDSSFRRFLEYVDIVVVLLQSIFLPYPIFFLHTLNYGRYLTYSLVLNICYMFDIYCQLTTAVIIDNNKITNFTDILLYRLKQTSFIVDVVASLPFFLIVDFLGVDNRYAVLFQTTRFLKFYKILGFIAKKEQQVAVNYLYIRLVKYIIVAILLIYWSSCILYTSSCFYEECFPDRWFAYNAVQRIHAIKRYGFTRSLFFSISLVLNVNISNNRVYTNGDMILIIIIVYLGYMIYSCCFAELAASAIAQMQDAYKHQEQISTFSSIMKRRGVNKELRGHLLNILEFSWMYNEGAQIYGEDGILSEASAELKSDIINDRIIECLKLSPVFKDCSPILLKKFSLQTEVIILPAKTVILNTNVMSNHVYVIIRGFCRMNSELPGDIERNSSIVLKRGDMLAPIETLHRLRMFGAIVSLTAVELLCITHTAFIDILQSSRNDFLHFQTALEKHMAVFESILMRKGCRLPAMKPPQKALGKSDMFVYYIEEETTYNQSNEYYYEKPFKDLGVCSFVKYLLMRRTINPRGKFYIVWEICRCLITFFDITVCTIYLSFSPDMMKTMGVVLNVLHVICLLDLYVRLHCQYYTDDGILVTHPLLTASHYIKTSFLVDAITIAPFAPMGLTSLFGKSYFLVTETLMRLFIRPLQLYRFFSAVSLIESALYGTAGSLVLKTKTIFLLIIILGLTANIVMIFSCDLKDNFINCKKTSWFSDSYFQDARNVTYLAFIHTIYLTFSLFAHTLCGVYIISGSKDSTLFVVMSFASFIYRTWILATFTSSGIGSNTRLAEYHTRKKWFLKFAKNNHLDQRIVKKTMQHYAHVWKETFGTNIGDIANKFNVYLRIQFVLSLYEETLKNTQILADAPTPVLQRFVLGVKEQHFGKGANIIRCNDVQDMLYFVYRGEVDVYVANMVLSTLNCGGIFGCFTKKGLTRQTITVNAKTHTTVLALKSKKLHQFLEEWEDKYIETYIKNIRLLNVEFLESRRNNLTEDHVQFIIDNTKSRYAKFVHKINEYIKFDSKQYKIFNYVLNVHIAPISSSVVMANLCISMRSESYSFVSAIIYIVDILFLFKIFLSMMLYYIDVDTGLLVRDPKKIFMRYLRADLILHVLANLPIELILRCFFDEYTKLGTCNRILRIIYFQRHYNYCKHNLSGTAFLAWINLIYWAVFEIQVVVSLWFLVACLRHNCKKSVFNDKNYPVDVTITSDLNESAIYGYSYVINLLTNSGFRDVIPSTLSEVLASIVIAILCQFVMVTLSTGFTNIVLIENNVLFVFQYKVFRLMKYLRNQHLSPIIVENIWTYLLQLWKRNYGVRLPSLIVNAPSYLKQDIMYHLYGYHLESHILFEKTHKHFVKQLVTFLDRHIYLPDNIIVEKGDIDSCMFFIHNGEVGVYDKHGTNEYLAFVLRDNMSFGMEEGLYDLPYKMTYRAITTVEALLLKRNTWEYLLEWFPASAQELKNKARECGYKGSV